MCAIAGIYETTGRPVDRHLLRTMTRMQAHRGPDGEGYVYLDPAGALPPLPVGEGDTAPVVQGRHALAMGHRRLAIIDLSEAGHQPMSVAGGRYWVCYNGELYNYLELRDELAGKGHRFESRSDTEVLLAAYVEWGEACVSRFNGMFAFAVWDAPRRRLFCSRDRLGEKPLYYHWDGARFAFASEIKAVLPACDRQSANDRAVFEYLDEAVLDAGDHTFFEHVRQLPPAHSLIVEHGTLRVIRYWGLPEGEPPPGETPSFEQAVGLLRELFEDAVRLRLRSDVAVGSCLSGGLDSSAIVCVAQALRGLDAPLQTFSSCFEDPAYDERVYILPVVSSTRSTAHFVFPDPKELLDQMMRLVWHQDEPFGSTSIFAQWAVMRQAKQHGVKVLLDGQGADEQLCGYHRAFGAWFADLLAQGRLRRLATELAAYRRLHPALPKELLATLGRSLLPGPLVRAVRGRMTGSATWLGAEFRRAFRPRARGERGALTHLRAFERDLLTGNGLRALLHSEDRNAMAFGVEARLPFLDHRLVELLDSLDPACKLRAGQTKAILREAMKGLLPEPVRLRRDKMGFVTPEAQWFRGPISQDVRQVLSDRRTRERGYLDTRAAQRAFEAHVAGRVDLSRAIWRWLNVELWCRCFSDERSCDSSVS